jgi:hypothetical protein
MPGFRKLSQAEADQFALILLSGAPLTDAVGYFLPLDSPEEIIALVIQDWPQQSEVVEALKRYSGGEDWHRLTDEQRLEVAIKKHYNEMAYFLWTNNYAESAGNEKLKADTCRQAIETKLAGMAGQDSPLSRFYHDMLAKYEHAGQVS